MRWLLWTGVVLAAAGLAASGRDQTPGETLVAQERAFCAAAASKGIPAAFLEQFAEGAVVFRPEPVSARAVYGGLEDNGAVLYWRPVWVDVSRAGDIGYTTGPYSVRRKGETAPSGWGHFTSIWVKQAGVWRLMTDAGISHGQVPDSAFDSPPGFAPPEPAPAAAEPASRARLEATLASADRDLSASAARADALSRRDEIMAETIRLYRDGELPVLGRGAARRYLASHPEIMRWEPSRVMVAASGDLGFTLGIGHTSAPAKARCSYLHIWKRDGGGAWRLVLDLTVPVPSKS